MRELDRLSSLLKSVELHFHEVCDKKESNLFILGGPGEPETLIFLCDPDRKVSVPDDLLAHAKVDMDDSVMPWLKMMPSHISIDLTTGSDIKHIASLIVKEMTDKRCGGQFALGRLYDLLVVSLLRHSIENHEVPIGVLAGLAHPRLSRVLVAIHDFPGKRWCIEDFVYLAGMSRSQFMRVFQNILGGSPMVYLKLWRMTAARSAIRRGDSIKVVAARLGYRSSDAFSRMFASTYGILPSQLTKASNNVVTEDLTMNDSCL